MAYINSSVPLVTGFNFDFSYLTISDLPQTFAEQLKRCKFDLSEVEGNQTDGQDDRRLGLAQSFRAEMLKSHNKIRSAYGGKELTESG